MHRVAQKETRRPCLCVQAIQYRWKEFTLVRVPEGVSPLVSENKLYQPRGFVCCSSHCEVCKVEFEWKFEIAKHRQRIYA